MTGPADTTSSRPIGRAHPTRFVAPVLGAVILLFTWEAVAHASGSGWVQGLGALAAGLLLVGMVGPRFAARRLSLRVVEAPRDARAGEALVVRVAASGPCRCRPVHPAGPATVLARERPTDLAMTPDHRGVLSSVIVEVASASPFGLLWWTVPHRVDLARPVLVAPRRSEPSATVRPADSHEEGESPPQLALTGELRTVREYRIGDSPRQVHWRASAHTGTLMVRETEEPADRPARVVADLPEDPDRSELAAGEVMGTVVSLLAAGRTVVLETVESGGRHVAVVADERAAGRRLARAGQNYWAEPPETARRSRRASRRR